MTASRVAPDGAPRDRRHCQIADVNVQIVQAPSAPRSAQARGDERLRCLDGHEGLVEPGRCLFVILVIGIDRPDVVSIAEQVAHRQHGGQHRVVLIVVFVQTIPTGRLQVREALKIVPD